jgi:RNA polymerase-interacting CarD/CdnL/TRCF family regulator
MRRKDIPMKYWGFYASEELKAETIKRAEQLNVSDSEYIRIAIESYNLAVKIPEKMITVIDTPAILTKEEVEQKKGKLIETHDILPYKWNSEEKPQETLIKPKMVQSFMKGDKK